MKKLIFVLVVSIISISMVAMFALTGCKTTTTETTKAAAETTIAETKAAETTAAETTSAKKLKVAYSTWDIANPYFGQIAKGVEDRCNELGYEISINDSKKDATKQVDAVENYILQKVDIIIISPFDSVSMQLLVKKAKDAGIVVINWNQEIGGGAPVDAFVTIPEYVYGTAIGTNAGNWIKDKLNGKADVAVLDLPTVESVIQRANGIIDAIKKLAPEAKVVATQSASNPEEGMRAMETILQANPTVEVVVGVNDGGALGAYEAIMAANKATDNFFVGGGDALPEALQLIKDGTIYRATVDIDPYNSGKLFVDTAIKVMENGPIKDVVLFPCIPVTSENINNYFK